jgi:hypothetical protein
MTQMLMKKLFISFDKNQVLKSRSWYNVLMIWPKIWWEIGSVETLLLAKFQKKKSLFERYMGFWIFMINIKLLIKFSCGFVVLSWHLMKYYKILRRFMVQISSDSELIWEKHEVMNILDQHRMINYIFLLFCYFEVKIW